MLNDEFWCFLGANFYKSGTHFNTHENRVHPQNVLSSTSSVQLAMTCTNDIDQAQPSTSSKSISVIPLLKTKTVSICGPLITHKNK